MKEKVYFNTLNVKEKDNVKQLFYDTLLVTNRSFDFFTNWEKIKSNFDKYRIELNILNSLINDINFDESLRSILRNYSEVLPTIPLLLALRKIKVQIVDDFFVKDIMNYSFDFSVRKLKEYEIEEFVDFFIKTGLKNFFTNLSQKSIPDYYLGVEVGLDSHARKNRSGKLMERFIINKINEVNKNLDNSFSVLVQKKYKFLQENYGFKITEGLYDRNADFLLIRNDLKIIAIETNFYSETGSKPQEIVNSYIQRQNELKKYNIDFIWITDGIAWTKQKNQMNFAFERLDYVSNIFFVKKGLLEKIIMTI